MYLLDTNVVSELRKPKPHGAVVAWLHGLAVVTRNIADFLPFDVALVNPFKNPAG